MCFTYQTKTRGRAIGMVRTSVQKVSLASCERGERIARGLGPSPYRPQPRSVWCTEGHLLRALCLPRGPPLLAGTCPALSATSGPPAGTLLVLPSSFSCKRLKCRRTPQSLPSPSPLRQLSSSGSFFPPGHARPALPTGTGLTGSFIWGKVRSDKTRH